MKHVAAHWPLTPSLSALAMQERTEMYGWRVTALSSNQSLSRCHGKAEAGDCGGFTMYCKTETLVSVGAQMRTDR